MHRLRSIRCWLVPEAPTPDEAVTVHCASCDSENVRRDASAEWNPELQMWELSTVFDDFICEDCGYEGSACENPMNIATAEDVGEEERAADSQAMQGENRRYFAEGV